MATRDRSDAEHLRLHITVSGQVQGVGFRYAAVREGRRLNLFGWARNTMDGMVEIVAEGEADRVRDFLAWCYAGPPAARVSAVHHEEAPTDQHLGEFDIRW